MYSEHGLDAVIRPVSGLVCQSLMVSSYCRPGSAHSQAAVAILVNSSRASTVSITSWVLRARSPNSVPSSTARMNSSLTRTELLAFWYCTEVMSTPPRSMSKPASRSARILCSSRALVCDELLDVGVVDVEHDHLGRTTRGAAGLDGAGRGVGAAHEGDRAARRTAAGEQLLGRADPGEVEAGAGAALEDEALLLVPVEDGVHRVVDAEDEAGADLLRRRRTDVEPDRGVEREVLVDQQPGHLVLEGLGVGRGREVPVVDTRLGVGLHDPVDQLLEAPLAYVGADRAAEVLGGDDRGGVDAPEVGELHAALLEDRLAGLPVLLDDVAALPGELVVGVGAGRAEDTLDGQALACTLG